MFAVFAFIVYFTFLWMLLVRDEPATITQQQEPNHRGTSVAQLNQSVPQPVAISSSQPVSLITTTASPKKETKDLEKLGIRELRKLSRGRIQGFMRLKKDELVRALQYEYVAS